VGKELGGPLRKSDQIQELEDALAERRRIGPLVDDQRLADDRAYAHPRIEGPVRILEHGLHGSAIAPEPVAVQRRERCAVEADRAARRRLDVENHP
jgi:hypothetical protein